MSIPDYHSFGSALLMAIHVRKGVGSVKIIEVF